jgi:hypothetical protein
MSAIGQPADPNDPASIDATADALFQRASASTACATPVIVLNALRRVAEDAVVGIERDLPRPRGTPVYVVRAFDTSGTASAQSAEVAATSG